MILFSSLAILVPAFILLGGLLLIFHLDYPQPPPSPTCLCLDDQPDPARVPVTVTVPVTVSVPVTEYVMVTTTVAVTRNIVMTRYVPTQLPRDMITRPLELMWGGGEFARVSQRDIAAMEASSACYVTDVFPARLGGLYYHIYVCMLTGAATEEEK